jgi:hypothetical protein
MYNEERLGGGQDQPPARPFKIEEEGRYLDEK